MIARLFVITLWKSVDSIREFCRIFRPGTGRCGRKPLVSSPGSILECGTMSFW